MARLPRYDAPGQWHHVMGRALARRTLFETELDIRFFQSLFARHVREGTVEIHAHAEVSTHFHFLIVSLKGLLSFVMQDVLNRYVRYFNRGRRRDGPLMRGRFESRPVDSITYRLNVVRYIDFNAVEARLAEHPFLYPFGSARFHAAERGPKWLCRDWIDEVLRTSPLRSADRAESYSAIFGAPLGPELRELIEQRLRHPRRLEDPIDDLLLLGAPAVLRWMQNKARLGDGTSIGHPVCTPGAVDAEVFSSMATRGAWSLRHGPCGQDVWPAIRAGMLRTLCAITREEIALRLQISPTATHRALKRHQAWISTDAQYANTVSELAARAIEACYGSRQQIALLRALSDPARTVPGQNPPG